MQIVKKPKIIIRTDGASNIGLGHVRRCLSLAKALTDFGAEVEFHIYGDNFGKSNIRSEGYEIAEVDSRGSIFSHDGDCNADCVVADSYAFNEDHYLSMTKKAPVVAVIDDMGKNHMPVDMVINQNLSSADVDYTGRKDTVYLKGAKYAMLDKRFDKWRNMVRNEEARVLVVMGGADLNLQTEKIIHSLFDLPATFYVDVIIGAGADSIANVKNDAALLPMLSYVHVDPPDVASIMARATVAVCPGGVTALELASLGVATLTISVADNQIEPARALHDTGASMYLGHYDQVSKDMVALFLKGLLYDFNKRREMSFAGKKSVDCLGSVRVAGRIIKKIGDKTGMTWVTNTLGNFDQGKSYNLSAH